MSDEFSPELEARARASTSALAELMRTFPPGVECALFLMIEHGDRFESVLAASCEPETVASVVRGWLERYDAGEATPFP
jgi:hypothetical protein